MPLAKINPTKTNAWQKLQAHYKLMQQKHLIDLFQEKPNRAKELSLTIENLYLDYSKQNITTDTLNLLIDLAQECHLKKATNSMFSGKLINETENRAVLHTALRDTESKAILVANENIIPKIKATKNKIKTFTKAILEEKQLGATGKAFTDVVNIGIGGSHLGPQLVLDALKHYKTKLNTHFIANIDGDHVQELLQKLNPETTLFIVVSKSFGTEETLTNARTIRDWFITKQGESAVSKHFVAVSANTDKAIDFGIAPSNIFPMWDWVGGRYSLWSAVGLIISLGVGFSNFEKLLQGAFAMDKHFKDEPFGKNMPVLLALISIWNSNFYNRNSEAVIPYTQYLDFLPDFLQQMVMESNGKSIDRNGDFINYNTSPIIWGSTGTNAQHAFFQALHQGTSTVPIDFIVYKKDLNNQPEHQLKLLSHAFAQSQALMVGTSGKKTTAFKHFEGNKPSNTLLFEQLTPFSLGQLLALYEHKTFVQGIIWNIYSFDQFGVELGKVLSQDIQKAIQSNDFSNFDSSTAALLAKIKA